MTLKNGDFIKINYTETIDGQLIRATDAEVAKEKGIFDEEMEYGPRTIVIGAGQLVKGFEEDFIGKEIGYSGQIEVPPEQAYGVHDPEKTQSVTANKFKDEKPHVGMRVSAEGKTGTVTRIIGRKVTVDFNHPLADKTAVFDYQILEQIEDETEKLKSMIKTFARADLEARIVDRDAEIVVPWEISYYKEWFMIRRGLADMILQTLGLNEVRFVEKHTGQKVTAEMISPPGKEPAQPEAEAAQETEEAPEGSS
ncbi:MAG: peptidylprolyl isomerase [Methanosarcinales archaeon]|nr:peptidylprolyl isomerase [Methanosarcinales archaeon]